MKNIKILGTGCPKCHKLAEQAEQAARQLGLEFQLERVTDISTITSYGVLMTPALVVDEQVKCVGKVPGQEELKSLIG